MQLASSTRCATASVATAHRDKIRLRLLPSSDGCCRLSAIAVGGPEPAACAFALRCAFARGCTRNTFFWYLYYSRYNIYFHPSFHISILLLYYSHSISFSARGIRLSGPLLPCQFLQFLQVLHFLQFLQFLRFWPGLGRLVGARRGRIFEVRDLPRHDRHPRGCIKCSRRLPALSPVRRDPGPAQADVSVRSHLHCCTFALQRAGLRPGTPHFRS